MQLTLRPLRKDDADRIASFFQRLSPETRYRRFHTHLAELTPAMLRYLVDIDGRDHAAMVAVDGRERIVGVARYVRLLHEPKNAEVAVTIEDELQRRGIGTALLDALGAIAVENQVETFVAYTLSDNVAMSRLLGRLGPLTVRAWPHGYGTELSVRTARPQPGSAKPPSGATLSASFGPHDPAS